MATSVSEDKVFKKITVKGTRVVSSTPKVRRATDTITLSCGGLKTLNIDAHTQVEGETATEFRLVLSTRDASMLKDFLQRNGF